MPRAFTALGFSPAVKAAQARYGAREHAQRIEQREPANDRLPPDLAAFIKAGRVEATGRSRRRAA